MKKFLSLVLALTMMMSLVTINAGAKEFTDDEELNYKEAVDVISEISVVDGYEDGSFKPQGNLSRQELIKILSEYSRYKKLDTSKTNNLSAYTDRDQVTWALAAVSWSVGSGIVMGTSATELSPTANGTREQLATILSRYLDHYPSVLAA